MSTDLIVSRSTTDSQEWDSFAARCGASFRCAYRALLPWQFDHHVPHTLRRLDIVIERQGQREKIGQCAVGISNRRRVFSDSLMLLPAERHLWSRAMEAVLAELGEGEYHYGSQWNLEAPRETDLVRLPGVAVTAAEAITVHAVSFADWASWEAYQRGMSSNARRNAKRAQEQMPDLGIELRQGLGTLRRWHKLHALKNMLAERKQLDMRLARQFLRFAMRLITLRQGNFLAIAQGGGQDMAAFAGIDFGSNTYFLDSGARDTRNGTGWHLMISMLQRAYQRAPQGYFVMGAQYANEPEDEGLHFSRRQCRVAFLPTSEVTFRYDPAMSGKVVPLVPRAEPALPVMEEEMAAAARAMG